MSAQRKNDKNAWYIKLLKLLKLEVTTGSGRINLAGIFVILIFCVIYTAGDTVSYAISAISDTVKSVAIKADIYHPYEADSVFTAAGPVLIGLGLCLLFLYLDEKRKQSINEKLEKDDKDVKSPHEQL